MRGSSAETSFIILMLSFTVGLAIEYTSPVPTEHGPVLGEVVTYDGATIHRYMGIPYASPPLGNLRFAPPEPPTPWKEPRDVSNYGNRCVSDKSLDPLVYPEGQRDAPPMDEDCLSLYLVVPQCNETNMAVMVYIHGGGLSLGSSFDFRPDALAIAGDIVVVSINYRLNIFGFLASEDDSAPGNVGFLDQVMALEWVKKNIASFRGDPDRITIFGESAGSWSVSAHMISPLSAGLFDRAIMQSGSLYGIKMESRQDRSNLLSGWASKVNCPTTDTREMLVCLRKLPANDLHEVTSYDFMNTLLNPGIYGDGNGFLPRLPEDMYKDGEIHQGIDLIAGITSDEGAMFTSLLDPTYGVLKNGISFDSPQLQQSMILMLMSLRMVDKPVSGKLVKTVMNKYFQHEENIFENVGSFFDIYTDLWFYAPTMGTIESHIKVGNKAYLYYFDEIPKTTRSNVSTLSLIDHNLAAPEIDLGAVHGDELLYMFGLPLVKDAPMALSGSVEEKDSALSRSMVHTWTTFAKTGKAVFLLANDTSIDWPQYDSSKENYLRFEHPMTPSSVGRRLRPGASDFWNILIPAFIEAEERKVKAQKRCFCYTNSWLTLPICCMPNINLE